MTPETHACQDQDLPPGYYPPSAAETQPWKPTEDELLRTFTLENDWRHLLSRPDFDHCEVLNDCVLSCSVTLEAAIPVKKLGVFPGYLELPPPSFPKSIELSHAKVSQGAYRSHTYFVPLLALREYPEPLNTYLDALARALPRARAQEQRLQSTRQKWLFGLDTLLGASAYIYLPDSDASDTGHHSLYLPDTPEELQSLVYALRKPATGRSALINGKSEDGEPMPWLGSRSWIEGDKVIIDDTDMDSSHFCALPYDTQLNLMQRVTLERKALANALDQACDQLEDVYKKIRTIFNQQASSALRQHQESGQ